MRKVRLARVADREEIEMPPGTGEMEARGRGAPAFALVRACAPWKINTVAAKAEALHYAVNDDQGVGEIVKNSHHRRP